MAISYKRFEVGSKVFHENYGEGMVVEVRPRPFFDVLEVAFSDGVRRLNSNHPKISDRPPRKPRREAPRPPQKTRPGKRPPVKLELVRGKLGGARSSEDEAVAPEAAQGPRFGFRDDILALDHASVESILQLPAPADGGDGFARLLVAERLGLTRGFQTLMSLSAAHDLEQYPFQIDAVKRVLREMRGRAILADEVGLGKTIEAGLILKEYALRGLVRRALILTPVSLMSQWREELRHKFEIPAEIYARGERWDEHPWLIASIDTAKTEKHREGIAAADFDLVIVDEAHRLRNHLTQGWKFIDALSPKYLLLLTATPVQNDLRELYNLVTLVRPGQLGTYREFRKRFMQRGNKRLPKDPRSLAEMLSTTMVRTSRSSTSIVFPKREVRINEFEMSPPERRLYDGVSGLVRETLAAADPEERSRWHFLLLLLQKEMGSSAPSAVRTLERAEKLFPKSGLGKTLRKLIDLGHAIDHHSKLDGLLEILRSSEDDKVLVFTQFRSTLEFLQTELQAAGFDPEVFHGSLSAAAKDQAIERFKKKKRILLSTEAGGEGRNLQFCRTVVNYDLPWNPMRIEQRIGRVHRLGQTRDTRIWNFTSRETVEDYVLSILHEKIAMFELVIGEMDMVLGQWSERDNFEQEVFRIWAEVRDPRERRKAFDALADDLSLARHRYEQIKDYDHQIFEPLGRLAGRVAEDDSF